MHLYIIHIYTTHTQASVRGIRVRINGLSVWFVWSHKRSIVKEPPREMCLYNIIRINIHVFMQMACTYPHTHTH